MTDLNRYIRKFWNSAELTVFGSSGNGFAFRHSDLDISLTFRDRPTAENLNCIEVRQYSMSLHTGGRLSQICLKGQCHEIAY
jgi:DNA polymerase sigma